MDFFLLGPLAAAVDGRPVSLGRTREQLLLAVLLLDIGKPVEIDRLIDVLWDGGDQPRDPRAAIYVHVSRLRQVLAAAYEGANGVDPESGVSLESIGAAYVLHADPATIDAYRFTGLIAEARSSTDPHRRADLLTQALGLWRGDALAGLVSSDQRELLCRELHELRIGALEMRVAADLELGRHEALVPELVRLTASYPTRERLTEALMLALHRTGRQTDALTAYDTLAANLADTLGLDPGEGLRRLRTAILRDDAGLRFAGTPTVAASGVTGAATGAATTTGERTPPATLPAAPFGFVGRANEIGQLDALVSAESQPRITALSGSAGIGKTALVVHWAHRTRHRFPDGQLYVDLRGFSGATPLTPLQALGTLLSGLGVAPVRVPVDLDAAAALFRTLTADLRVLIVLDNAYDIAQVRPLLPGGTHCFTVVTSRNDLDGLIAREGARPISLTVLTPAESAALLTSLLGEHRADQVSELAVLCAHLPLAMRIAAANIAERRSLTIGGYVESLRTGDRLSALQVAEDPETAVRVAFDLSYDNLDPVARQLFRMIGVAPGRDLSTAAVAQLVTDHAQVRPQLRTLLRHHLVEEPEPGRYSMHDLLRAYATEQSAAADTPADRAKPAARLLAHYLRHARGAAAAAYPHAARLPEDPGDPAGGVVFPDAPSAMSWLEAERANLTMVILNPPDGLPEYAWLLADQLRQFFALRRYDDDWLSTSHAARRIALDVGDRAGLAAAELCLGWAYRCTGRYTDAVEQLTAAADSSRRVDWLPGQATARSYLGIVHSDMGSLTEATRATAWALALAADLPPQTRGAVHNNHGVVCLNRGDSREAVAQFSRAVELFRDGDSLGGTGIALVNRGFSHLLLGEHHDARDDLIHGLVLGRRGGDRVGETLAITSLALLRLHRNELRPADRLARAAARTARAVGDQFVLAYALTVQADVARTAGDPQLALRLGSEALAAARGITNLRYEIEALIAVGSALAELGQHEEAVLRLDDAVRIAEQSGYRTCHAKALTALARAHSGSTHGLAATYAQQALALHHSTGYAFGQTETLQLLTTLADQQANASTTTPRRPPQSVVPTRP